MSLIFRYPRYSNVFDEMFHEMDRLEKSLWFPQSREEVPQLKNTSTEVVNDENKFAVNLNVSHFKPEELKVNLNGRILSIEGKHEEQDEHSSVQRSFLRKWVLPEDIDLSAVRSQLDDKGFLSIEAPKMAVPTGRNIAIEKK